jgi:hypothetical protein
MFTRQVDPAMLRAHVAVCETDSCSMFLYLGMNVPALKMQHEGSSPVNEFPEAELGVSRVGSPHDL